MLITENYKHLKISTTTLQNFDNNVQNLDRISVNFTEQPKGFWQFLKAVLDDFVENCNIPGLERIFASNLNGIKRFLWLCGFTVATSVLIYISCSIVNIQETNPLVTVVSTTHYPVYQIPFPEITICNKNRFNWQRYRVAKEKFLKAQHHSPEYEEIFRETINIYDTLTFGKFNKFENLTKTSLELLETLNYVNFSMVADFMAWKCYEIFADCMWLNQYHNCCEIFFRRNSQMGSCLAFNTIESVDGLRKQSLDPYWPWRTPASGLNNGLTLKVLIREDLHSPKSNNGKGIMFMLVEPNVWFFNPIEINTHTSTTVTFSAILHYFDNYTRFYSSDIRQCVFEDELSSMYYKSLQDRRYMYENCQAECQQENLKRLCNCTLDLFYPPGSYKSCQLSDLPCLYEHNDKLQYFEYIDESEYVYDNQTDFIECLCYFNCKSLTYITNINAAHMSNENFNGNSSYVEIAFYFARDSIMVYCTTVTYTWTDLMGGIGGLAGLCIGCSLLSMIELIYFFLADIPRNSFRYFKNRNVLNRKSHESKYNISRGILRK